MKKRSANSLVLEDSSPKLFTPQAELLICPVHLSATYLIRDFFNTCSEFHMENTDVILFLLSQTWSVTLRIQEQVFSGCTVLPDSKETKLGSSNQETSPSADKNTGVALVLGCVWKCVPTAISVGVDILEVHGCHLLQKMSSQWGSQKLVQGLVSHELSLPFCFWPIFNSMKWPYHQKDVIQITLNHATLSNLALPIFKAFVWNLLNVNLSLN